MCALQLVGVSEINLVLNLSVDCSRQTACLQTYITSPRASYSVSCKNLLHHISMWNMAQLINLTWNTIFQCVRRLLFLLKPLWILVASKRSTEGNFFWLCSVWFWQGKFSISSKVQKETYHILRGKLFPSLKKKPNVRAGSVTASLSSCSSCSRASSYVTANIGGMRTFILPLCIM